MKNKFVSLNIKIVLAATVGVFLALFVYFAGGFVKNYVLDKVYLSDEAIAKGAQNVYDDLKAFIDENRIKGTDTEALNGWMRERKYTYLFIYDDYKNYYSAGWWPNEESADMIESLNDEILSESELYEVVPGEKPIIDEEDFLANYADAQNQIVEFADGKYYAYVDVRLGVRFQRIMDVARMVLAYLVLFSVLLIYHSRMLKRIGNLESKIQKISDGNLDYEIRGLHNDELGRLANNVDNMRRSLIKRHKSEKEAWDANVQLITAMSHDIRTPLTSLIGYMDIIESGKYADKEELRRYFYSGKEKALQLKELSDKLFGYFLVFGKSESDRQLERFDASVLLTQIIGEHGAELVSRGYTVKYDGTLPERDILADITGLRRIFDNVFSNILKYADPDIDVKIFVSASEEAVHVRIANGIPKTKAKIESTRIGLKTCERICAEMKGAFTFSQTEEVFEVKISFPVTEKPEESAETGAAVPEIFEEKTE